MGELTYVIDAAAVPVNRVLPVQVGDKWYAVCNDAGTYHVTAFHCPHAEGPLTHGEVCDGHLICPVHHWPWNLATGLTDPHTPWRRLPIYRTEFRDGKVYADVSEPIPADPQDQAGFED